MARGDAPDRRPDPAGGPSPATQTLNAAYRPEVDREFSDIGSDFQNIFSGLTAGLIPSAPIRSWGTDPISPTDLYTDAATRGVNGYVSNADANAIGGQGGGRQRAMDDTPPAGPTVNPNRTGLHPGTEWPVGGATDSDELSIEDVFGGPDARREQMINDASVMLGYLPMLRAGKLGHSVGKPLIDLLTSFLMGGRRGVSPSIAGPQSTQRLLRSPVRQLSSPTPTRQLTGTGPAGPASRKGEQLSLDL